MRVRQAISLAIDRDALITGAYAGLGKPGLYPISTAIPQPDPPTDVAARYDPEAARALLAEAGLADGFDFTLSINPSSGPGPYAEQVAVLIQDQLRDVGIGVNIDLITSPADFNTATRGGELDAWLFGTRPLVNDVAYFLLLAVGPMSVKLEGYGSEEVDALLGRIVAEPLGRGPRRPAIGDAVAAGQRGAVRATGRDRAAVGASRRVRRGRAQPARRPLPAGRHPMTKAAHGRAG